MRFYRKLVFAFVLLCFTTIAATTATAQDDTCSATVAQALAAVQDGCSATARNQACYGYVALSATPREGVENFTFSQEGDLVNVGDLSTLRLSALDTTANTWGIAMMKLQANLPATLPGQNVTFLMFGDVEIQNAVEPGGATVGITSNGGINIRNSPSTNGAVIGSLSNGETLSANGRNADSTWLRIQIPDSDSLGWVFAELVTPDGDVSVLPVVDASSEEVPFQPMQAFYFQTGISETTCDAAPADGILIQTPEGAGKVNLRANDVDIQLGSTAFLQAQPSSVMTVSVVEGEGTVTSNGETLVIPAGSQVTIPVDDQMRAIDAPSDPQPYTEELVDPLPVQVLPEPITVAPPLSEEDLQAEPTHTPGDGGMPGGDMGMLPIPGGDASGFEDMDPALFCQYMNIAFQQMGMTKEDYLAQIQPVLGMIPAESRAEFDAFLGMLEAC